MPQIWSQSRAASEVRVWGGGRSCGGEGSRLQEEAEVEKAGFGLGEGSAAADCNKFIIFYVQNQIIGGVILKFKVGLDSGKYNNRHNAMKG